VHEAEDGHAAHEAVGAHAGHEVEVMHSHEVADHGPDPHGAAPGSASMDDGAGDDQDHSCGGCEGNCGLCCQNAGATFLPGPIATVETAESVDRMVRPARMGVAVLPAPPAFLLPFANAPPSPAPVTSI